MIEFIVFCIVILIQDFLFMHERSKLLDRIQARDLAEYKLLEKSVQKKKEEPKEYYELL